LFVDGEDVLVNELNTMPVFPETNVDAKLWEHGRVTYPELCDRLVWIGVERFDRQRLRRF
jgi:D-alanine-D-alanine ligase